MSFKSAFQRIVLRTPQSFDDVRYMTTERLPVPGFENSEYFLQFTARRAKTGDWTLHVSAKSRSPYVDLERPKLTWGLRKTTGALRKAVLKHTGRELSNDLKLTFDEVFLILREAEEAHLKYNNTAPPVKRISGHYTEASDLLPQQFREGLDDLYKSRIGKESILPPKVAATSPPPLPKGPK